MSPSPNRRGQLTRWQLLPLLLLLLLALSGCAASRTQMTGSFNKPASRNQNAEKVNVAFLFRHLEQQHGYDSIPKLQAHGVKDFDNLFRDALGEISNIGQYETFTESPADVNNPKRRKELETQRKGSDYTVEVTFFEESSFQQQCLSAIVNTVTLTVVPMPYAWDYTVTARVYDQKGSLLQTYQRKATLKNWVEFFLMFAYPWHPIEGKREAIYAEALHDIFRQLEAERVLKK